MSGYSIKIRLLSLGAIAIIMALGITGFGLTWLFERHVERRIGTELDTYINQIASRLSFERSGMPRLGTGLADPRFENIYSGLYWQINNETAGSTARSRSLWDIRLGLPNDNPDFGKVHIHEITGPLQTSLLVHERRLRFKFSTGEQIARLIVAIDRADLDRMSGEFANDVATALVFLGLFLLIAGWVQVMIGLGPLSLIQKSIAAIRGGAASRMKTDMPAEVLPLAHEINDLLAAQHDAIENARHRASDLAHGFKTPLTALKSDVQHLRDKGEFEIAGEIEATALLMQRQIERELTKARIRDVRAMQNIEVRPVIEAVVATLRRTPDGETKDIQILCDQGLKVQFDMDDLTEILGNLMENAVKHAARKIVVRAYTEDQFLKFEIDDDGDGISNEKRDIVQQRGVRLDRTDAGSGLGLSIVTDILDAYGQSLELDRSPLGGLQARFQLPLCANL